MIFESSRREDCKRGTQKLLKNRVISDFLSENSYPYEERDDGFHFFSGDSLLPIFSSG